MSTPPVDLGEPCGSCNAVPAIYRVLDSRDNEVDVTCRGCAPSFVRRFFDASGDMTVIPYPLTS